MDMKYILIIFQEIVARSFGNQMFSERDFRLAEKNGRYFSVILPERGSPNTSMTQSLLFILSLFNCNQLRFPQIGNRVLKVFEIQMNGMHFSVSLPDKG